MHLWLIATKAHKHQGFTSKSISKNISSPLPVPPFLELSLSEKYRLVSLFNSSISKFLSTTIYLKDL
ncbi:Uncharacterised protein [Vibrio cholerae]|uniref:Uncharacterized protein n=1 Tax=Vibrio cholerae TaxID=666 RepID=A0A655ZWF4_VIBCL|nr:Uncharacterised protein [Vibrio cholerae]CSB40072.1 Uncharacterised protein [Vibrio cholerae]CSC30417.1 Uncharacterised protein [Vibrio cholerae]CSC54881.1 Uncharacterised protein [Vibrio cholerae]CSC82868.1 Uncharacterised protein [Vibrio cholerae]